MNKELKVSVDLTKPTPYLERHTWLSFFRRKLTHRYPISLIRKHVRAQELINIFDIGTGSGTFLQAVVTSSFKQKINAAGVEFDERLVDAANRRLGCASVFQGNAEEFKIKKKNSYDVVTSFHVIEHLYNPEKLILNARALLNDGGIFIVATPNLDSIAHRVHGDQWQGIRDDHVSLKRADEWDELILRMGFKKISTGTTFFSGLKIAKIFPINLICGGFSLAFGAWPWKLGESFIGIYRK